MGKSGKGAVNKIFVGVLVTVIISIIGVYFLMMASVTLAAPARLALLIGNGAYDVAPLTNPAHDAADLAAELEKLGFTVAVKTNADRRAMITAIQEFGQRLRVRWDDINTFAGWLTSQNSGNAVFRLPTEAEWEYAARAGTQTVYSFGNDVTQLKEYAWYNEPQETGHHPVGQKQPNAFGLNDMHGNVWEWVTGNRPRGGSWNSQSVNLRCANRGISGWLRLSSIGARLVHAR